jgi:hypothetical protein
MNTCPKIIATVRGKKVDLFLPPVNMLRLSSLLMAHSENNV